jgi:hypothetical protein
VPVPDRPVPAVPVPVPAGAGAGAGAGASAGTACSLLMVGKWDGWTLYRPMWYRCRCRSRSRHGPIVVQFILYELVTDVVYTPLEAPTADCDSRGRRRRGRHVDSDMKVFKVIFVAVACVALVAASEEDYPPPDENDYGGDGYGGGGGDDYG